MKRYKELGRVWGTFSNSELTGMTGLLINCSQKEQQIKRHKQLSATNNCQQQAADLWTTISVMILTGRWKGQLLMANPQSHLIWIELALISTLHYICMLWIGLTVSYIKIWWCKMPKHLSSYCLLCFLMWTRRYKYHFMRYITLKSITMATKTMWTSNRSWNEQR